MCVYCVWPLLICMSFHSHRSERLLKEHPGEDDVIRRNRVKGRLQPTRGLGDGTYKRIEVRRYD